MNQPLLLDTANSVQATQQGRQRDVSNDPANERDIQQAFSSELDKQIEQHQQSDTNEKKTSQQETNNEHDKQQAEVADDESGKLLPDDKLPTEQVADNETDLSEEELLILVQQQLQPLDQKTNDIHKVSAKADTDNKIIASKIQKTGVVQSADIKNIEQTKKVVMATELDAKAVNKLNAEPEKAPEKIRPDILQALSKKSVITNNERNAVTGKTVFEELLSGEKNTDKQLQLPEILKQIKSGSQSVSQGSDKNLSSFANILTPLTSGSTTSVSESVGKTELPSLDIQANVHNKAWSRVLSSRVILMARDGIQQAEMKLNPANLGPLEVKLNMHNDQVNVTFIAHHAATRDALEQALPRLRESLLENGMELADADVSQQEFEQAEDGQADSEIVKDDSEQRITSSDDGEHDQTLLVNELEIESGVSLYV